MILYYKKLIIKKRNINIISILTLHNINILITILITKHSKPTIKINETTQQIRRVTNALITRIKLHHVHRSHVLRQCRHLVLLSTHCHRTSYGHTQFLSLSIVALRQMPSAYTTFPVQISFNYIGARVNNCHRFLEFKSVFPKRYCWRLGKNMDCLMFKCVGTWRWICEHVLLC